MISSWESNYNIPKKKKWKLHITPYLKNSHKKEKQKSVGGLNFCTKWFKLQGNKNIPENYATFFIDFNEKRIRVLWNLKEVLFLL